MSENCFTEREALAVMDPRGLTLFILNQSAQLARAERLIGLANQVLATHDTDIDKQMDLMRDETNTQTISTQGS